MHARLAAGALILFQILLVRDMMPLEDRWFFHADDHEVFVLGRQVAQTGLPVMDFEPTDLTPTPAVGEINGKYINGKQVSFRAPGVFYLVAPAAAISPQAAFVTIELATAAALFIFYLFVERHSGAVPALAALAFLAFTPPMLFWQSFLFSNAPALGVLFLGLLLLSSEKTWAQAAGAAVLVVSVLFRYDYLAYVLAVGLGWLVAHRRAIIARPRAVVPTLTGGGLALAIVLSLSLYMYGTINFVGITRGADLSGSTYESTLGAVGIERMALTYQKFIVPLLIVAVTLAPAVFLRRNAPHWTVVAFALATAAMAVYFLGTFFYPQRFLMSHAYTRYLIPLCALGGLGLAQLVQNAAPSKMGTSRARFMASILVAGLVLNSVAAYGIVSGPHGFETARRYTRDAIHHVETARLLPDDAILLGDYAQKTLLDRPVLNPWAFPDDVTRNRTVELSEKLLASGYRLYLAAPIDAENWAYDRHKYGVWFDKDPRFELRPSDVPGYWELTLASSAEPS